MNSRPSQYPGFVPHRTPDLEILVPDSPFDLSKDFFFRGQFSRNNYSPEDFLLITGDTFLLGHDLRVRRCHGSWVTVTVDSEKNKNGEERVTVKETMFRHQIHLPFYHGSMSCSILSVLRLV